MTATATEIADIYAAWQLIAKHGLDLYGNRGGTRTCAGPLGICGVGSDDVAAVKAWAEAAGVPWEPPQVVEMSAILSTGLVVGVTCNVDAEAVARMMPCQIVPCVVVINREGE